VLDKFSDPLLSGAGICSGRRAARLRNAQVAGCRGLGDFIDHEFQRLTRSAGVEKDRFVDGAILLFEALVVRQALIVYWFFLVLVSLSST